MKTKITIPVLKKLFTIGILIISTGIYSQKDCINKLAEYKKSLGAAPDSVFQLVQKIIDGENPNRCKAAAYNVQVISKLYSGKYVEGDSIAKIGKKFAKSVGEDSILGRITAMHGAIFDYMGDVDMAYKYYSEAGDIFYNLKDTLNYGDAFNNIGLLYFYINDFDSAEYFLSKAAYIFESETQDLENRNYFLSSVYLNLGNISYRNGYYNLANDRFFETLKYGEENNDLMLQIPALSNIAGVYMEIGKNKEALKYINKSIKLSINDPAYKKALLYYKKGVVYDNTGFLDSALLSFEEAKALYAEAQLMNEVAMVENSIGGILINQGNVQEGIDLCFKNLQTRLEFQDTIGYYVHCHNIALGYFQLKNLVKAEEYCKIVNKGLGKEEDYGLFLDNKKLFSEISFAKGNASQAYQFLREYAEAKDSSFNNDLTTHQSEMEAIYQVKDKEKMMEVLKKEKAIQDASLELEKAENAKQKAIVESQNRQRWYLIVGLALVTLFGIFMFNRFKVTNRQKNIIDKQKSEVEKQKEQIENQHQELEEIHKEISDSIKYAERLQLAILPSVEDLRENLKNGFVLFQPKDVVSGDFYWMQKIGETVLFAAADCTGHGVPGAMVSVVCSNALNRAVNEFGLIAPKEILEKTRELVIETFARSGKDVKDGMDIALCALSNNKLTYSGANNPLWIMRAKENLSESEFSDKGTLVLDDSAIIEFKPNKQPIGLYDGMKSFDQTEIQLFEGDTLYIFTDGFADQFGGERNKKLMYKPFKKLLIENRNLDMETQKENLTRFYAEWRGDNEQIDDVCVIGVKI